MSDLNERAESFHDEVNRLSLLIAQLKESAHKHIQENQIPLAQADIGEMYQVIEQLRLLKFAIELSMEESREEIMESLKRLERILNP